MKKIAFVLYTYQLLSIAYLGGLPLHGSLKDALHEALDDQYDITFDWETALKNKSVDAIIVPKPFPPILNETTIPEIPVSANLFFTKDIASIKKTIDHYFNDANDE